MLGLQPGYDDYFYTVLAFYETMSAYMLGHSTAVINVIYLIVLIYNFKNYDKIDKSLIKLIINIIFSVICCVYVYRFEFSIVEKILFPILLALLLYFSINQFREFKYREEMQTINRLNAITKEQNKKRRNF